MTYEQHTITGELEITDSKTMKVIARKLILTAERTTSLQGRIYTPGWRIECLFPANTDLSTGHGKGPWVPGGYSGTWLKQNATEIKRLERVKSVEPHQKSARATIHVSVTKEFKAQIMQIAMERGIRQRQIAREALEMWLKSHCRNVTND